MPFTVNITVTFDEQTPLMSGDHHWYHLQNAQYSTEYHQLEQQLQAYQVQGPSQENSHGFFDSLGSLIRNSINQAEYGRSQFIPCSCSLQSPCQVANFVEPISIANQTIWYPENQQLNATYEINTRRMAVVQQPIYGDSVYHQPFEPPIGGPPQEVAYIEQPPAIPALPAPRQRQDLENDPALLQLVDQVINENINTEESSCSVSMTDSSQFSHSVEITVSESEENCTSATEETCTSPPMNDSCVSPKDLRKERANVSSSVCVSMDQQQALVSILATDPDDQQQAIDLQQASTSSAAKQIITIGTQNILKEYKEVELFGHRLSAFIINGQEWLCSYQLSQTLLRGINGLKVRSVKSVLRIFGVRCKQHQLELLYELGVIPTPAYRYGLIKRSDAERLCRWFLIGVGPDLVKAAWLPLMHRNFWGCRGRCVPASYKHIQSKCVDCDQCGESFTFKQFIYHSHGKPFELGHEYQSPSSKRGHTWRLVLELDHYFGEPTEEMKRAWEDVKALYKENSRQRP